jgi:Flp pilus assembly protein TadD
VTWFRHALLLVPLCLNAHPCESCHPREVAGYSHSSMSRSLRRPNNEPAGSFVAAGSGNRFTIRSDARGTWQRIERSGEAAEYPVAYVIGSGSHAAGYLIEIAGHLFQSPICYYTNGRAYGLAPGYENIADPDFTRPVGEECVLCHSGQPLFIRGSVNRYEPPVFAEEPISCERCHGPTGDHLRRPVAGSIVNPAKLPQAARDSICEQCHLAGVTRVLNPGRSFADFRPGGPLEDVFTVYTLARPAGDNRPFKVISHAEQLAQSACARNSQGRLWCGTCHDPHAAVDYNARCQSCHRGKLLETHPAAANCTGCHMARRQAEDGGHTVFTDHRITRRPQPEQAGPKPEDLVAWREPNPALRTRNLAIAYSNAGISSRSPARIVRGYRMLTEVQASTLDDIGVLKAIGRTLLLGKKPLEALRAFDRVLKLSPGNASAEEDVGTTLLEAGELDKAASHLQRALELDPLLLSAATALEAVYRKQGNEAKAASLNRQIRQAMRASTAAPR